MQGRTVLFLSLGCVMVSTGLHVGVVPKQTCRHAVPESTARVAEAEAVYDDGEWEAPPDANGDAVVMNQTVMPEWNHRCGAIRFNYKCSGQKYQDWLSNRSNELLAIDKSAKNTKFRARILFVGNSHMREVAETFTCQRRDQITKFEAISTETRCLSARAYSAVCNDLNSGCRDDLAKVTLTKGGHIYFAINHLWLYQGEAGMRKILADFGVQLSELSAVVLGNFNPRPTHLEGCNEPVDVGKSSLQSWSRTAFADYLSAGGFKGKLLLGGMFGESPAKLPQGSLCTYPFSVEPLKSFKDAMTGKAMVSEGSHLCIPGTPSYIGADVAEHLT